MARHYLKVRFKTRKLLPPVSRRKIQIHDKITGLKSVQRTSKAAKSSIKLWEHVLSHKLRCYTRISGPGKNRNNTREKIYTHIYMLIHPISCLHVNRLWCHSVRLMNERKAFTILSRRCFSELSRIMAAKTLKKTVSLTDNEVKTFLEEEENQYAKRKTESCVFSGFGVSISLGWEWKSTIGRFATGRYWPFTWKTSSVGKDKDNKWEFCKSKITTIVVFVIMIQRIFPS